MTLFLLQLQNPAHWTGQEEFKVEFSLANALHKVCIAYTDKDILDKSYYLVKNFRISCSRSTELLKTSNLTLKRKQFCTPREGNLGNVLLTTQQDSSKIFLSELVQEFGLHTKTACSFFIKLSIKNVIYVKNKQLHGVAQHTLAKALISFQTFPTY